MDPYGVLENIENEQETSTGKCSFKTFDRVPNKSFAQFTGMN